MAIRRLLLVLGLVAALVGTTSGVVRAEPTRLIGTVVGVVDGDTLRVRLEDGTVEVVRLRGIDAPESRHPTRPAGCYGTEATARLGRLAAAGSSVELGVDAPERDRFGRLVAYVWRENAMLMLNEQILAEGFAVVLPSFADPSFVDAFSYAEGTAKSHGLGLWGACPNGLPDPTDDAPILDP
jgi:micrococcal nuclease